MVDRKRFTDEEAKELRQQLSFHYGDELFTVTEFCDALKTWSNVAGEYLEKRYNVTKQIAQHLFLAAEKSSLLGRMLYGKEKPRKTPCPVCKGEWCGCFHNCPCGGCGWVPEEKEQNDAVVT